MNKRNSVTDVMQMLKKYRMLIMGIVVIAIIYHYDALFDTSILLLFVLASFSIGSWIKVKVSTMGRILTQTTIGIGILGFAMHYILLAGIGNRTLYLMLIIVPIFLQHKKICTAVEEVRRLYRITQNKMNIFFIGGCIFILFVMGNSVVTWADALSKYLSCVTYAAQNGSWKTNIVESIIYADQFTMYCSLATIGVALGAERFMIWISTLCMCMTLLLVLEFTITIYKKTNIILVASTFLTIPMFLRLGTDMCIDFAQVLFLMAAILCMADLELDSIWNNLYAICFLCSCAIFSKLTASYIVLSIGIPIIVLFFTYIFRRKISFRIILCKIAGSVICLSGGLWVPVVYGIYYMGSPVLPWLNGIFESPYVAQGNFVDPFQNNVLGINLSTLTNIVFHTSRNMEINDGFLGVFLFGLILIPLGFSLYRNSKYIFWFILALIMFKCATFFTYNLRYYIAIFVVLLALEGITLSIICDKLSFKRKWIYRIIFASLMVINVFPNIYIMARARFMPLEKDATTNIYENELAILLKKYVPEDKWVFGKSVAFRGDWTGTLYSDTWYNEYLINRMREDNISYEKLMNAFDYMIVGKNPPSESEELAYIIQEADKPGSMLKKYAESENIIIYEVKDTSPKEIVAYSNTEDIEINTSNSIVYKWDNLTSESYKVSFDALNENDEDTTIFYQIAYLAEDETILSREYFIASLEKGSHHIESVDISVNHNAAKALLGIYTYATENSIYINNLSALGEKDRTYINGLVQEYYNRIPIREKRGRGAH